MGTRTGKNVPATRIAEVADEQIDDGGIVLLHDSALYGHRPSAMPTAEAIPLIAERAKARGLALVSPGDASPADTSRSATGTRDNTP